MSSLHTHSYTAFISVVFYPFIIHSFIHLYVYLTGVFHPFSFIYSFTPIFICWLIHVFIQPLLYIHTPWIILLTHAFIYSSINLLHRVYIHWLICLLKELFIPLVTFFTVPAFTSFCSGAWWGVMSALLLGGSRGRVIRAQARDVKSNQIWNVALCSLNGD